MLVYSLRRLIHRPTSSLYASVQISYNNDEEKLALSLGGFLSKTFLVLECISIRDEAIKYLHASATTACKSSLNWNTRYLES